MIINSQLNMHIKTTSEQPRGVIRSARARRVAGSGLALLMVVATACGDDGVGDSDSQSSATATEGSTGDDTETDASTTGASTTSGDTDSATESDTGTETGTTGGGGQTYPDPDDAPSYDGKAYVGMQIYDVEAELWMDELALMEALDPTRLIFVGEQHETPAIHELQRWMLEHLLLRHGDVTLAMEHFQSDEQDVIDSYLAGDIDSDTFESTSDPWNNYSKYWKQLVDTMKLAERPVLGVNVPNEALDSVYAAFPSSPLEVFNSWDKNFPYDAYLPPRPLDGWDAVYQGYFEQSYDYESHGKDWGLTYEEALDYFTALALIRDDTMGYFIARHLENTDDKVLMVGGDWHVQTGLATADSVTKFVADIEPALVTTTPLGGLDELLLQGYGDRPVADYVLVYEAL